MGTRVARAVPGLLAGWLMTWLMHSAAVADGLIIVEPEILPPHPRPSPVVYMPLEVRYHRVKAAITDAVAVTRIDQTFHNPGSRRTEGTFIFPLADDVAVQKFSMFINGREVKGEILDKEKARRAYQTIVSKMRDPALLEYVGTRMYRAKVFPIEPNGDVRVKLDYSQQIPVSGGVAAYRYPLNTEKFSSRPIGDVSVHVMIESGVPIKSVFCPSHEATVQRTDDRRASVGYEATNVKPDKDFLVYYHLSEAEFGLALLTHRRLGEDGFFMARVAPRRSTGPAEVVKKDICFVLDTSGSMAGEKMEQAKRAMNFCLSNLNEGDRFAIVAFSTEVRPYKDQLVTADKQAVAAARKYVSDLKAVGGTNINQALLAALRSRPRGQDDRPYMIIFLTDGMPTVDETDVDKILRNVAKANAERLRLFVFGIGSKVNTKLLDKLAEDNRGAREYVVEKEDLELKLSSFYTKVASPVLTDLSLAMQGVDAYDILPKQLPDLFRGSEVVVMGRYKAHGRHAVILSGLRNGMAVKFSYEGGFPERSDAGDFLPRLWAMRKVGYLLDQIRMHGESKELKDEIVQLGKKYAIVTPYTAALVIEDMELAAAEGRREPQPASLGQALAADRARFDASYRGALAKTGRDAIDASARTYALRSGAADAEPMDERLRVDRQGRAIFRQVAGRAFWLDGQRWLDSTYDGKAEPIRIAAFSKEYFDLLARHPEAGRFLALGEQVLFLLDGRVYEIVKG